MALDSLEDFGAVIWQQRGTLGLTTAFAVASALLAGWFAAPLHEAVTEFYVPEPLPAVGAYSANPPVMAALELVLLPSLQQDRMRTQQGLLESEAVQIRVHAAIPEKPQEDLTRDVDVSVTRTHLLRVRVRDRDPELPARIANAYPQAFVSFLSDTAEPYAQRSLERARTAFEETRENLAAARAEFQAFLERSGTADVNGAIAESLGRRGNLERELEQARTARRALENRIIAAEDRLRRESKGVPLRRSSSRSEATQRLGDDIAQIQEQLAITRAGSEDADPKTKLRARLEDRKRSLSAEIETLVTSTQKRFQRSPDSLQEQLRRQIVEAYVERAALEAEVAGKNAALQQLSHSDDALPAQRMQAEFLRAELERLQRMTDVTAIAYEEARAQLSARAPSIVVVREARGPSPKIFPLPVRSAVLAACLGLLGGIYLAFGWDALQRRQQARSAKARGHASGEAA